MNHSHLILAMLAAPAALCGAAYADAAPEAIGGYLPCNGTTMAGAVIRPVRDASFVELHRAAIERFIQLPKEKQEAINAKGAPDRLMSYDADLWPDKAEYDKYAEAWKKTQMARLADVRVGFQHKGGKVYSVLSATRVANGEAMPLTIGSLQYDGNKNVWISNNGELKGKEFTAGEDFDYGPQAGNEWVMEKKDSLSALREMVRLTKSTDGKAVFLYYSLTERSAISGTVIANHGYTIIFPITSASAATSRPGRK
ncbi:MAG: hypothetical protein IKA55_04620 [Akkermansia sp.]|nr:hypothetical protein [Akkermansia sp.]